MPVRILPLSALSLLALLALPSVAAAQPDDSGGRVGEASLEALADEARMRVRATAGAWYAALSGETRFGSTAAAGNLSVESFLDLEDNEASFAGDLALFIDDRWLVQLSAFDYATEATTSAPRGFRVNGAAFAAGTGTHKRPRPHECGGERRLRLLRQHLRALRPRRQREWTPRRRPRPPARRRARAERRSSPRHRRRPDARL